MSMILAATGHRFQNFEAARQNLKNFLDLNAKNVEAAISGMAAGWDTIFARACQHYNIPLHCYIPYKGQQPTSDFFDEILSRAALIKVCADKYYARCFLDRDDRMVEDSSIIIACWDGRQKGGTFYTVNKAIESKKLVINLWKSFY